MTTHSLAVPDSAGQTETLRRTLPDPATCLADPDHD